MKRLSIDTELCEGHGRCYELAPGLVDADERGYGVVVSPDVGPEDEVAATAAVNACPEHAVGLT